MGLDFSSETALYYDLRKHVGHEMECVEYCAGEPEPANVAIECVTCGCIIIDANREDVQESVGDRYASSGES
jgi:hypothetical protein